MSTFLGMLGSGDWATDQRPKAWREMILLLYPNGMTTLTGLTAKMQSEKVSDPEYNWWTESLSRQGGTVSSIYIDYPVSTEYVYATHQATFGVENGTVYAVVALAVAQMFRVGDVVKLRDADQPGVDVQGEVASIDYNAASSVLGIILHEADDNHGTSASYNLATVDTIINTGDANSEGSEIPDALHILPTKYTNYTEIFREPLEITRTNLELKLRTGDQYQELKRQILLYHGIRQEKAYLMNIAWEGTGSNGKPKRTTEGVITNIRTNASDNVDDYPYNSTYTAKTWKQGGKDWLDEYFELFFRYGDDSKLAFCGSTALMGINQLAEQYGQINLQPATESYGLKVIKWITPFGEINLKTHPLMTQETTLRSSMVVFEPRRLRYRYVTDTTFYPDPNRDKKLSGHGKIDGIKEEYLTEAGLEFHHPSTGGFLTGLGSDGATS